MLTAYFVTFLFTTISAAPAYVVTMFLKYKLDERRMTAVIPLAIGLAFLALVSGAHSIVFAAALVMFVILGRLSPLQPDNLKLHVAAIVMGGLVGSAITIPVKVAMGRPGALDGPGILIILVSAALFLAFGPRLTAGVSRETDKLPFQS